jgi:phosphatidate phosphatase APP1
MKFVLVLVILFTIDGYDFSVTLREPEPENRRQITFYTTYGYLDGDTWVVPARVWVNKKRRWLQGFVTWMLDLTSDYNDEQIDIFYHRLRDIAANSKSRRTVSIRFRGDPEEHTFRITNEFGVAPRTDRNGIITGTIEIPVQKAERFLEYQQSEDGWLTAEVTSTRYSGTGRIQLIKPEGISVISDIDDTVKVTEIPAGAKIVVRNTFFKEYTPAPVMADMYAGWPDAAFHYVSGSPWQLFNPLRNFLFSAGAGFPEGTLHLKNTRKNPLTISTWRDLRELITNENVTFDQKIYQISALFEHFPDRQFILVGDSGERDPEVYSTIHENYPDQVKEIFIRDVINDRERNPERLAGMTIIPAPTIFRPGEALYDPRTIHSE